MTLCNPTKAELNWLLVIMSVIAAVGAIFDVWFYYV